MGPCFEMSEAMKGGAIRSGHTTMPADLMEERAFALAALGRRREAWREIRRALRAAPRERRSYLAALVALRLVSAERVVRMLNRRGRGI